MIDQSISVNCNDELGLKNEKGRRKLMLSAAQKAIAKSYVLKEEPHPHEDLALGLLNVKPRPNIVSTKSS
jgi:hypothetical protein